MTDRTAANIERIRSFIEAWSRLDADELASWFAEDGCYHNMPTGPVRGRAEVATFIRGFISTWTSTTWDILTLVGDGNRVVAERLDRTTTSQGDVDLPCCGVFELDDDGLITVWRDYFDLGTYMRAMQ